MNVVRNSDWISLKNKLYRDLLAEDKTGLMRWKNIQKKATYIVQRQVRVDSSKKT